MQATTHNPSRPGVSRQAALIAVAIMAAALAAAALRFERPMHLGSAAPPQGPLRATVPVRAAVEWAVGGDPSVPRASAVFRASSEAIEELPPTF